LKLQVFCLCCKVVRTEGNKMRLDNVVSKFQRLSHLDICRKIWSYSSDKVKSNSVAFLSDMTPNPYANVLKIQNLNLSFTFVTQM